MDGVLCPIVVGRDTELATLVELVGAAAAGRGRLVCLVGEAGVGKSRLVRHRAAGSAHALDPSVHPSAWLHARP